MYAGLLTLVRAMAEADVLPGICNDSFRGPFPPGRMIRSGIVELPRGFPVSVIRKR